jgi:serine-type D-Ala-D-Ala carboxypeptidase/endopeptidase (penicillin-binding protein 4)
MKKLTKKFQLVGILSLALFCFGINFAAIAAQEVKRDRVIEKPTPTPKITPTPRQTPVAQPIFSPTPTATPTPVAIQTLSELQTKIRQSLARPELRRGQVGIKIVSLDTGKVLFDENSEKYFMPASNMKSFTVAAALARLTPDFRFVTSVYAGAVPDASGTIRGDLTIYGRGDPSISYSFNDGDFYRGMNALAEKIVAAGVKRVEGNLIGDESYFNTEPIPATWEWDDLQWYYGAEVSALTANNNAVQLVIRPASTVGAMTAASLMPNPYGMVLVNRVATAPAGTRRELTIYRKLGSNMLEISGRMAIDDKYESYIAAVRPANAFISMLRQLLEQKGVVITGQNRVISARDKAHLAAASTVPQVEITRLESVPFREIAAKTMKPSQNLYTELILRALGEAVGDKTNPRRTSEARGIGVVQNFLTEAGVAPGSVVQYDGSGLSRHNLITPAATARLYEYMNRHPHAQAWREAQTIAGVDGTLQNRFRQTPAENNVRGKTGTIDQVSALSGYITTAGGEKLVFSILTNGIPQSRARIETIDEIVVAVANFNGRTN